MSNIPSVELPVLAVVASGEGTNFSALYEATQTGVLRANLRGLISDVWDAGVLQRGAEANVEVIRFNGQGKEISAPLASSLQYLQPDIIALAGFNRIIKKQVLDLYPNRFVNTHSAPLRYGGPGMYGPKLREVVLKDGLEETEVNIQVANETVDGGRLLGTIKVPIHPADTVETLEPRLLEREHYFYPRVLDKYLEEVGLVSPRDVNWSEYIADGTLYF